MNLFVIKWIFSVIIVPLTLIQENWKWLPPLHLPQKKIQVTWLPLPLVCIYILPPSLRGGSCENPSLPAPFLPFIISYIHIYINHNFFLALPPSSHLPFHTHIYNSINPNSRTHMICAPCCARACAGAGAWWRRWWRSAAPSRAWSRRQPCRTRSQSQSPSCASAASGLSSSVVVPGLKRPNMLSISIKLSFKHTCNK